MRLREVCFLQASGWRRRQARRGAGVRGQRRGLRVQAAAAAAARGCGAGGSAAAAAGGGARSAVAITGNAPARWRRRRAGRRAGLRLAPGGALGGAPAGLAAGLARRNHVDHRADVQPRRLAQVAGLAAVVARHRDHQVGTVDDDLGPGHTEAVDAGADDLLAPG